MDSSTTNLQKSHDVKNDDFANKINDFLQSANYLNNLPSNTYSCDKCDLKFASKDFLDIHKGATHKIKCEFCQSVSMRLDIKT